MTEKKYPTLGQMITTAVAKPKEYKKIIGVRKRTVFVYLLLLALVLGIIQLAVPALSFCASIGGPRHFVTETLPDFEMKNNEFHIDHRVEINQDYVLIEADSDVKKFKESDVDRDKMITILVSKSNMILVNTAAGNQQYNIKFKNLSKDMVFNNETLADMLPMVYGAMTFGCVFAAFYLCLNYMFGALFLAICGKLIIARTDSGLRFKDLYVYALMARLIPSLVDAMVVSAGVSIGLTSIWSIIITVAEFVLIWVAIRASKDITK